MEGKPDNVFITDMQGNAHFLDESSLKVGGRNYYKLAIKGTSNISEKLISRKDGKEVYIFSIPIYHNQEIIGTLQQVYKEEEINTIFAVSLYSDEGFMYVINSEGYIIFHSKHDQCQHISSNYYRDLYENGNEEASKQIEKDVLKNKSGFFEITMANEKYFSAFTPLEDLHDWYLISSVSTDIISYNSSVVMKIFYAVLGIIILIFLLIAFIFWNLKNSRQKELLSVAFVDNVTKGNTLNKFIITLKELLEKNDDTTWYIWKFDIDNFKYINKYYGFDLGDHILFHINDAIQKALDNDEMIARISSDNFVVLLNDASEERIISLLNLVRVIHDVGIYYSSGLYQISERDENVNFMIDKASMASNSVKDVANTKIAYYSQKFEKQLKEDEELKRAINNAFENDEFIPYFQPKVNIETKEIVGSEALARWRSKDKGLIPPDVFVPVCEKTGLVTKLDMLIFDKVLAFIRYCLDHEIPCYPVSVNFSRAHLLDDDFLSKIVYKMELHKIPRHLIEIELTESAIFDNIDTIAQFTEELHELGLTIAMDDFGSGYSSLNMLKEIPIDILKIDRVFLRETKDSDRRRIIFTSVVEMVRQLHIKVIVEGVETQENVDLMKACNCYYAQGYYFAKPMELEAMIDLYKEGKIK